MLMKSQSMNSDWLTNSCSSIASILVIQSEDQFFGSGCILMMVCLLFNWRHFFSLTIAIMYCIWTSYMYIQPVWFCGQRRWVSCTHSITLFIRTHLLVLVFVSYSVFSSRTGFVSIDTKEKFSKSGFLFVTQQNQICEQIIFIQKLYFITVFFFLIIFNSFYWHCFPVELILKFRERLWNYFFFLFLHKNKCLTRN